MPRGPARDATGLLAWKEEASTEVGRAGHLQPPMRIDGNCANHHAIHPTGRAVATIRIPSGASPREAPSPQPIQINLFDPQNGRGKAKLLKFNGEWLRACTKGQSGPRGGLHRPP